MRYSECSGSWSSSATSTGQRSQRRSHEGCFRSSRWWISWLSPQKRVPVVGGAAAGSSTTSYWRYVGDSKVGELTSCWRCDDFRRHLSTHPRTASPMLLLAMGGGGEPVVAGEPTVGGEPVVASEPAVGGEPAVGLVIIPAWDPEYSKDSPSWDPCPC